MDWSPLKYLKSQNCQNTEGISFLEYNIFPDNKFFKVRHFPIVYITEDITVFSMETAENWDPENIRKIHQIINDDIGLKSKCCVA